jgi:8-oxo-dGTP diphosphatase
MMDMIDPTPIAHTDYATEGSWCSLDALPTLAFDHYNILQAAYRRLRVRIPFQLMAHNFLPKRFTMSQLLILHESLLETELDKRNFSKKILSMNLLIDTNINVNQITGRPARLYEFDLEYQEPAEV